MTTEEEDYTIPILPIIYKSKPDVFVSDFQCRLDSLNFPDLSQANNFGDEVEKKKSIPDVVVNYSITANLQHADELELHEDFSEVTEISSNELFIRGITEEILSNVFRHIDSLSYEQTDYNYLLADSDTEEIPRFRRCSSLKSNKTKPDEPGAKKIVRFADVLGLDLADVRTYLDDVPKIPHSAFDDLVKSDDATIAINQSKTLEAIFQQPGTLPNFVERLRTNQVLLESVEVNESDDLVIRGVVRVRNLDFAKSVWIRYTLDNWSSHTDLQANYADQSSDGFSDKFTFLIKTHALSIGQRLEFAVRFECLGNIYWDNNEGGNYCFHCAPLKIKPPYDPMDELGDHIAAFYYSEDRSGRNDELSPADVQNYITQSLEKSDGHQVTSTKKPELLTICLIILFSIVFLYIRKLAVM